MALVDVAPAHLVPLHAVTRPTEPLASERLLPAGPLLSELLPFGGLQRGTTTVVGGPGTRAAGSTTLVLELLASASATGGWCGVVGFPELGLAAARERGIALDRLLLVPFPGDGQREKQVLATLFDALEAVLFVPGRHVSLADARKLTTRARERGSTLLVLDRTGCWGEGPADLRCRVVSSRWEGLGEGHGALTRRVLELELSGRGAAARPRRGIVSLSERETA